MKHFFPVFIWIVVFFISVPVSAQITRYYLDDKVTDCDKASASYYKVITTQDSSVANIKTYTIAGKLVGERNYSDLRQHKLHGSFKSWFGNGQLESEIYYKNGKHEGALKTYFSDGKPKRNDFYKNDSLITGKCFAYNGSDTAYYAYNIAPQFPGGFNSLMQFISSNIRYPKEARKNNVEGLVVISFVVNAAGKIEQPGILKSIPHLDNEVIRMVGTMPSGYPG